MANENMTTEQRVRRLLEIERDRFEDSFAEWLGERGVTLVSEGLNGRFLAAVDLNALKSGIDLLVQAYKETT